MSDIDREVAEKVMGWRIRGVMRWWLDNETNTGYTENGVMATRWSPSTNIAHAWEVVEKLVAMHDDGDFHLEHLHGQWKVGFCARDLWFDEAETAPLAICRAALAVVEET